MGLQGKTVPVTGAGGGIGEAFPTDKWDRALAVNLSAAFHTICLALLAMKARNRGRIINMAPIHALDTRLRRV